MLRVAVIGTGFVGPHHVDAVRRGGYAEVVALAGSDPERTQARAKALGVAHATTDLAALLTDPELDVVHVCTPNATHVALAEAALEAGKHVVVEKPLAFDAAEADRLVALARRAGRHASVTFTYRGYPMVREARRLVANGDVGAVRLVHGVYLQDWLLTETDYNWRLERDIGGPSRAVADIGSHWFDTAEYVSSQQVTAVLGDLATFLATRRRPRDAGTTFAAATGDHDEVAIESEDAATILVRFGNGALGSIVVSQVSAGHKNDFRLEVCGEKRSLAWRQERPNELWLGSRDGGGSQIRPREPTDAWPAGAPALPAGHPEGWSEALRDLFRPFYAAIASGMTPQDAEAERSYPSLAEGARAVRFTGAVLESAASGSWATLDPGPRAG